MRMVNNNALINMSFHFFTGKVNQQKTSVLLTAGKLIRKLHRVEVLNVLGSKRHFNYKEINQCNNVIVLWNILIIRGHVIRI